MAKQYRIQRWSPGRDKWIFWLSEVYDNIKLIKAEVQDLNQGREYIKEDISFRFAEVGKQRGFKPKGMMDSNPFKRVIKIHDIPPAVDVGST